MSAPLRIMRSHRAPVSRRGLVFSGVLLAAYSISVVPSVKLIFRVRRSERARALSLPVNRQRDAALLAPYVAPAISNLRNVHPTPRTIPTMRQGDLITSPVSLESHPPPSARFG